MKSYEMSKEEVLKDLGCESGGLSSEVAQKLLAEKGKNELVAKKKKKLIVKFFEQFKDVMIIVLIVAAVVSAVIAIVRGEYGELVDSGLILLIVIINAIIGLVQENKAENALDALKSMNKPFSKVYRDGQLIQIPSTEIVVGDIVQLDAGDIVPADMRLISSSSLQIEESALTGESLPSDKDCDEIVLDNAPLGDRCNMAYSSGVITYGRGTGVVTATGMGTEVGKIATMLNENIDQSSPLQKQLGKTAKLLSVMVLAIAAIIFIVTAVRGEDIVDALMTAVAIAVAAIPEGLPAVVTIVLAMGVQKMSKRNAIVKNLTSVETLGCCEIICSDKTGTLTLNQMTVKSLYTAVTGVVTTDLEVANSDYDMLVQAMALCNDSQVNAEGKLIGDPTETALVYYAMDRGVEYSALVQEWKRVDELPFDSVRKIMSTVNENSGKRVANIKGAPDMLIDRCKYILVNGESREITAEDIASIKESNESLAKKALRVLGIAIKYDNLEHQTLEQDLIFVGLVGMIDPPRKEVKEAVKVCAKAGMRPIMITGDHIITASAIAKEIGILRDGDKVMLGSEMDTYSDEDFSKMIEEYSVFARVSPENKVRIVDAYQRLGKVVAMTGDGVNDAPSIKKANIGVGMGITGTDVSKGAADMVLVDDNFATIIGAVEEGRKIFANIKKAIQFLLSANFAEVVCLFIVNVFLGIEFLTPVMILWVNLVTDSLPALALGMEQVESDIMDYPPRKVKDSLFAGKTGRDIVIQGLMQTVLVLSAFLIGHYVLEVSEPAKAMTMAFISLALIQLIHSYNLRSQTGSLFHTNPFSNKYLNYSFIIGLVLILLVVLIPPVAGLFGATTLTALEWLITVGVAVLILPLVELQKFIERKCDKRVKKSGKVKKAKLVK